MGLSCNIKMKQIVTDPLPLAKIGYITNITFYPFIYLFFLLIGKDFNICLFLDFSEISFERILRAIKTRSRWTKITKEGKIDLIAFNPLSGGRLWIRLGSGRELLLGDRSQQPFSSCIVL